MLAADSRPELVLQQKRYLNAQNGQKVAGGLGLWSCGQT